MSLTQEQNKVLELALDFLKQPNKQHFAIHGLAGTGKTTLLCALATRLPRAIIVAPTGKAASVLRKKSGKPVLTLHSAIYNFKGLKKIEDGQVGPVFQSKSHRDLMELAERPILLDESSMVGAHLAEDLLRTGALVIACGDPGQLPPVKDRQFFSTPDATLQTIHRQALDSPIIRQAHAIRANGTYGSDGIGFSVVKSSRDIDIASYDIVLCWTNGMRQQLNRTIRAHLGREGELLKAGEPLMCLKNDYEHDVFNGEVYNLGADRAAGRALFFDDGTIVSGALVEGFDEHYPKIWTGENDNTPFALAYAATAHKFQGSEAPRVLVYDEMPERSVERSRWLYTAVTRAQEHVTVVRIQR